MLVTTLTKSKQLGFSKKEIKLTSFRLLDLSDKSSSTGYKGKCEGGVKHFQYKNKKIEKNAKQWKI